MTTESPESFSRRHGYALVSTRRGYRVLGPRERARCRIDGEYFANADEGWRAAARRIAKAVASKRIDADKRQRRSERH